MPTLQPRLSPLLTHAGFRHGFYGRVGGVSTDEYVSLNCSYSVGDQPEHVTENLRRIAADLGLPVEGLVAVSQVHGCSVVDVDIQPIEAVLALEADALVGIGANCALTVRTADCVPVLVGCRSSGNAAAIHAGWRGVVAGIVPRAIDRLLAKGAHLGDLVVAIGPHIGVEAFEVSPEVASELNAVAPRAGAVHSDFGPRPHVRLSTLLVEQLRSAGLKAAQIDDLGICTYTESLEFFSFRRDGKASGRQLSAIRPRCAAH